MSVLHLIAATVFTVALYAAATWVQRRTGSALAHPLLVCVVAGCVLFSVLPPEWLEAYLEGSAPITWALGPATAALAVPFFRRRRVLAEHPRAVFAAVLAGTATTVGVAWGLGRVLGLPTPLLWATTLKSVTLPVALELAGQLGTDRGVTTLCVFVNGLVGSALGPALLTWARVTSPLARGLALGTLSHAIGTARALEEDPLAGAAGVVALTLSAGLMAAAVLGYSLLVG
jgi:putative effector of murein hydrolase